MTNTHRNCDHDATKGARAKCRRTKGATLYIVTRTAKRVGLGLIEPCTCRNTIVHEGICTACDRPADLIRCA